MKYPFSLGVIVLTAGLLVACSGKTVKGNGNVTTQQRSVAQFDHIQASGALTLMIVADKSPSVTVTTDDNLQSYVLTTVKNNTLDISSKKDYTLTPTKPITVTVDLKQLKSLTTAGVVNVNVSGIDNNNFNVKSNGTSQLILTGSTEKTSITVAGASNVDARNLIASETNLDVSGTAKARVYASKKLTVKISGSGQVVYYGKPPIINQAVFGSGKIEKAPEATQ